MNFRQNAQPRNPIFLNVTAFVDILLCLLVFLISSWAVSQLETELGITLPEAKSGATTEKQYLKVVINLQPDGSVKLNDNILDDQQLLDKLTRLSEVKSDQVVILRADRLLPYERVLTVLDICRQAKIRDVAFSALPTESS